MGAARESLELGRRERCCPHIPSPPRPRGWRACVGAAAPGAGVYSRLCVGERCLVTAALLLGPLPAAVIDAVCCLSFLYGSSKGCWNPWTHIWGCTSGGCMTGKAHLEGHTPRDAHLGEGGCTPRNVWGGDMEKKGGYWRDAHGGCTSWGDEHPGGCASRWGLPSSARASLARWTKSIMASALRCCCTPSTEGASPAPAPPATPWGRPHE